MGTSRIAVSWIWVCEKIDACMPQCVYCVQASAGDVAKSGEYLGEQAIQGMRDFIDNPTILMFPKIWNLFTHAYSVYPCSSSECERGFSLMNLIVTSLRTSLHIPNIASLMLINTNGPPLSMFECKPLILWKHGNYIIVLQLIPNQDNAKLFQWTKLN